MAMNINHIKAFPTLITLVRSFLTTDQCQDIVEFARTRKFVQHPALHGSSVSSHGVDSAMIEMIDKNVPSCNNFKESTLRMLNEYGKELGIPLLDFTVSWISFQYPGSTLNKHTHAGSIISGALYLKTDDDSSHIYFSNPNPFTVLNNFVAQTEFSQQFAGIKPQTGDLIIFPSWLSHGSNNEVNHSDERIVMSFNTIHLSSGDFL